MPSNFLSVALSLGLASLLFGVFKLVQHRRQFQNLPKPPYSFFWGHLKLFGEVLKLFPPNVHPQLAFTYLHQKYDLPEVFYVDLWPFGPVFMALVSPGAAAHVCQTRNYGKGPIVNTYMEYIVGEGSIVAENGALWKNIQHMLLPAFKPTAVRSLLLSIAEETLTFRRSMDGAAKAGTLFKLEEKLHDVSFQVIGRAVLGVRLTPEFQKDASIPVQQHTVYEKSWDPISKWRSRRKAIASLAKTGEWVSGEIMERYRRYRKEDVKVADCLVDAVLIERIQNEQAGLVKSLEQDSEWVKLFVVQVRSLLLGGLSTVTDTLCAVYMLLSVNPEAMQKLREEHDTVVGSSCDAAFTLARDEPHRAGELEYTTAVIKEAMRLFPIGFSVRQDDKDNGMMTFNSRSYPTMDALIVPVGHALAMDPKNFPSPDAFMPERWLPSSPFPPPDRSAWRPFELGPRACMGRALAMDEMRIVLLMTARWFDFSLADDGSGVTVPNKTPRVAWTKMDTLIGDMAFSELGMEAKPRRGMPARVKRTERPL